ncbi:Plasma membrane t-SNARE, secretory vesicle fusion [Orbilia ellipsospora]|uniref:Plasma membrane t-SNARE, secretory vesicle fusion n=1 Tax=Orbilia ellipsospora TaxID=2528407 RepID=A0AAV9X2X4_9PEZI
MTPLNGQPPQQTHNPQAFFGEIAELRQLNSDINDMISELENLHHETLNSVDENPQNASLVEGTTAEIGRKNKDLAQRIRMLKSKNVNDPDKFNQCGVLQRTFETTLNRYQNVEVTYQKRIKERVARQYKIANPNATEEEIREVVNGTGGEQIFAEATKNTRTGAARSALAEVRSRHNDIQKIERAMIELSELFEQMNQLVVEQQEVVDTIESHAVKIEDDTSHAVKELDTAIKSAEGARRKKWWCLLLVLIIIIIVVIIAVVVTKPWAK